MQKSDRVFLWSLALFVVAVIASTGYKFLIAKNYNFVLEAECNPQNEKCFYRDCSQEDCPPNNLENYKIFNIKAYDFPKCVDNSCAAECKVGTIACKETKCGESSEDVCSEMKA